MYCFKIPLQVSSSMTRKYIYYQKKKETKKKTHLLPASWVHGMPFKIE